MEDNNKKNDNEVIEKKEGSEANPQPQIVENTIGFDDFKKVEMVVALIEQASKVENADRLLKLEVDTGEDKRVLVAGVAEHYSPDELTGKKIIIIKNLKPAKIRGILSRGMILAASGPDGRPYIPIIPEETPVGAILK